MAVIHSVIQPVIESVFASPTQPRLSFFDPDAGDYFKRIMAAGSSISANNKVAVAEFIIGCKADGIWNAIKASCILAAADTLAGALVPLKGAAPTNVGPFIADDYSRTTGLVGNASNKYLNSNRNNNADPQNNQHMSVWLHANIPTGFVPKGLIGTGTAAQNSSRIAQSGGVANTAAVRNRASLIATYAGGHVAGLIGMSRAVDAEFVFRGGGTSTTTTLASATPPAGNVFVFAVNEAPATIHTDARIRFYSIGESLNLTQLDARLTTLMAAIT